MSYVVTRVTIHDETFRLCFDDESVLVLPLRIEYTGKYGKGDNLSGAEYEKLRIVSAAYMCMQAALRYISRSMRTEKQVRDYLKKKEYGKTAIDAAVNGLKERDLLNDRVYADEFLFSLSRRKVVGRKYAEHKLMQKGVASSIARDALNAHAQLFENEDALYELACTKYGRLREKSDTFGRLASFLQRRGFSTGQIMSVINRMKAAGYNFNE